MSTGVPSARNGMSSSGNDLGDDTFVTVASGHLVTDRELALGGDVNFDRLDDAGIDFVAGFDAFHLFVVLHLQIVELLLEAADDLVDLVADRRGIDLDAVVNARQLAQQRLGDLAIGRDDDFAGLASSPRRAEFFHPAGCC